MRTVFAVTALVAFGAVATACNVASPFVIQDALRDVSCTGTSCLPPSDRVFNDDIDMRRLTVVHGPTVKANIRPELAAGSVAAWSDFADPISFNVQIKVGPNGQYNVLVFGGGSVDPSRGLVLRYNGQPTGCAVSLVVNGASSEYKVLVPRSCLGNPSAIAVSVTAVKYHDDAINGRDFAGDSNQFVDFAG